MEINGSPKKLGVFELNICSILNPYDCQGAASKLFDVKLAKCAFEKTNLVFKLSSYFLSDMPNEKASGNLVTGNGVLNTSNYSIGQDNRFNVIKDTLSVNSYSGNSTGIKYSSSTKKEQKGTKEESASKKGEHPLHSAEYGFSGQEAKRQSPGVGYEPRRSYRHTDNRTEINDGISISKQLTDEQNRRSKL